MLVIENLTFSYDGAKNPDIFADFHFSAPEKGILYLVGENGSGKTTLLRLISGLALPRQGEIQWQGKPLLSDQVGFLLAQNNSSFIQLKGGEAIELYADLNQNKEYQKSTWWKILKEHPPFQRALEQKYALCSTGMRQLINLAICLTKPAEIYLFDEPYKGLDTKAKGIFNRLMTELSGEKLILLTSHEEFELQNTEVTLFSLTYGGEVYA